MCNSNTYVPNPLAVVVVELIVSSTNILRLHSPSPAASFCIPFQEYNSVSTTTSTKVVDLFVQKKPRRMLSSFFLQLSSSTLALLFALGMMAVEEEPNFVLGWQSFPG